MAIAEPRVAPTPFGHLGDFALAGVHMAPPLAWSVGDDARCSIVDPGTARETPARLSPATRDGCTVWEIPDEGLLEYFQFAHSDRPQVSGILRLSFGDEPKPLAPWDPDCATFPRLREKVEHYRLCRLLTACGLPVPGPGNDVYVAGMRSQRRRTGGAGDYRQETYHLLRRVAELGGLGPDQTIDIIEDEWVSQFEALPRRLAPVLAEARATIKDLSPAEARSAIVEWAGANVGLRQRRRPSAPTLEFGR